MVLKFRTSGTGRKQQMLSSIDRTNVVGIKVRMRLSRLVGYKIPLVMEDTKSRAVSPISVTC